MNKATKSSKKNRQLASDRLPILYSELSAKQRKEKPLPEKPVEKKPKPSRKKSTTKKYVLNLGKSYQFTLQVKHFIKKKPAKKLNTASRLQPRRILAAVLITAGLVGTAFFGYQALQPTEQTQLFLPPTPAQPTPQAVQKDTKTLPRSQPTAISVPDLGINTSVVVVGQQADGTMEVPTDTVSTGWYKLGPTPGELGPAIIVGHVDSPQGPAIFWRLRELKPGQLITITRADSSKATFEVTSLEQFEQNNFPTEKVYGNIDHAGLRLITCGGVYDRNVGRYSHNTVVFAKLVDPASS